MQKFSLIASVSLTVLLVFSAPAEAQVSPKMLESLTEIQSLIANPPEYDPISDDEVAAARETLKAKMAKLEGQLLKNGEQQSELWKSYLLWETLEQEVSADSPSSSKLMDVIYRFQGNHPGLEMSVFTDVRNAINNYSDRARYSDAKRYEPIYKSWLKRIDQEITKLKDSPEATSIDESIAWIGILTSVIERSGQHPELVKKVRQTFSKPNFHVQVSESLIRKFAGMSSTRDIRPVTERILGVLQRGTADTVADISVDLVPNPTAGKFSVSFHGTSRSDQVGTKEVGILGTVKICSEGCTSLVAQTLIEFDGERVSFQSVTGDARTSTVINGVDTPPFIRNAVLKQIQKQKSQGEAIAAGRARDKFVANVRERLAEALGKVNNKIKTELRAPAKRINFIPRRMQASTTSDEMRFLALIGREDQLSSITGPYTESDNDVVMQIHESSINNALQHLFGARTITNSELRELAESFGAELPDPEEDEKEFEITFPPVRPVSVSFDGDKVKIQIVASRVKQGTTSSRDKLTITATYTLETDGQRVRSNRSGDIGIEFEGQYTNAKNALEVNLRPKLEELFPDSLKELDVTEWKVASELKSVGVVEIAKLVTSSGWFTLEINIAPTRTAKRRNPRVGRTEVKVRPTSLHIKPKKILTSSSLQPSRTSFSIAHLSDGPNPAYSSGGTTMVRRAAHASTK